VCCDGQQLVWVLPCLKRIFVHTEMTENHHGI
jgi:hypothetical protein